MERILPTFLSIFIMLFSFIPSVFGQIGQITYFDGAVSLNRNGEIYDQYMLDIGFPIENYDILTTKANGEMTILLNSAKSPQAELRISSGTSFYIEINKVKGKEKTTIGLITGAIANNVKKLSGQQEYEITTSAVTMGVRGTSFVAQSSPAGDILVTCDEGLVTCYDDASGSELALKPGIAIEKKAEEAFKSIPVAVSSLEQFRKNWFAERITAFKANALRVTKQFAQKYLELVDQFKTEYMSLISKKETLNKWYQEEKQGQSGSKIQLLKEKKEIIGHLFKVRKVLFIFERVYFRLVELKGYHDEGIGHGMLQNNLSTENFFSLLNQQEKDLALMISKVKFITYLYAKRNDGEFPLSAFGDDFDF